MSMTPGQFGLLVVILALILAFVGLPWWSARRRPPDSWDSSSAYLAAIDALIRGKKLAAMEALRRVARRETENLLAYLRLGDLVRIMGYPEKAERIHAGLLARPTDDPELTVRVRESLLEDHLALAKWDEVVRLGAKLREIDRKNVVALRALTLASEARREWDTAFECLDEWERIEAGRTLPRPAQLRIHVSKSHLAEGRTKEARRLLEDAIKLDEGEQYGLVLLGDVWAREGEHEKAVEQWLEYARREPDQAEAVFDRLERSYFEMGRFGDLLQVYERLSQQAPETAPVRVALAEMHRRRGRTDEAVQLLEGMLARSPKNYAARRLLVSCLLQTRRPDQALREMDLLLKELPEYRNVAVCLRCKYDGADLGVKCPQCGAWQQLQASSSVAQPRT
jgi:lipopolysaccharide assembly protein B